jgi:hypothetical protein
MAGVSKPIPEWRYCSLYHWKNCCQKARLSWMQPKRSGNSGRYFRVLNWLSEYRLSSETGDAQVGHQKGDRLRGHDLAAVSVDVELPSGNLMFGDGLLNEPLGQFRFLLGRHHPAGDVTAEDVEHHVEIEIGPFGRT